MTYNFGLMVRPKGFSKIATKTKPFYVAEQIIRAIKRGEYKANERLPSERELAEAMGVSRSSVREALSALQVLGIVETRPGDGTYVKKLPEKVDWESHILPILEESDSPLKIFEARNAFEIGVIELAIVNVSEDDLVLLRKALQEMRTYAAKRDFEGYLKANFEFHMAIARATGNPVIERAMAHFWRNTSQQLLNELLKIYWHENLVRSVEIHERILSAIEKRDRELALEAIRQHYQDPKDYLLSERR